MQNKHEYQPGDLAPYHGRYEALNIFGTATGRIVEVAKGEPLPELPRGFIWRSVQPPKC